MTWVYLILAGLLEVVWASTMKLSEGFSKLSYSVVTIVFMVTSFYLLGRALKVIPMSLAYPIWTGIGAIGSVIVGVIFFKDQISINTAFFVLLLLVGMIGIKVTSGH